MKKIFLIIGGVIFIAVAGRAIWAWQQVKNDMAKVALVATAPVSSATKNVSIKLDDTTMIASSGPNIKVSGNINIENKQTFTSTQLAKLKSDLTQLYLKYQGKDKNTEPTKSEFGKELDGIFLRDLGVGNVSTENFGIFLYPEIAIILADIKRQYPIDTKLADLPPVSKITISNLAYDTISVSNTKNKLPPTFKISYNGGTLKCVDWDIFKLDASGGQVGKTSDADCPNSQYTSNEYSYRYLFYNSDFSPDYFAKNGVDHIVVEFYVRDVNNGVSNRLKLTFTK